MVEEEKLERVTKKSGRHYKKPKREVPVVNQLFPLVSEVHAALADKGAVDGPSVTTILGILAKPALISWAAREERKMVGLLAAKLYTELAYTVDEPVTPAKFLELLMEEAGRGAHKRLLAKAANVGTEVHNRIEWEMRGELKLERAAEPPLLTSEQAKRSFSKWEDWRKSVKLKAISLEKRLFSTVFGFGGTLDLLAEITITVDGVEVTMVAVIDYKTGKHVYEESFLQNIAYRIALLEEGIKTDGGIIVRLPKYEDDPEFEAVPVPDDADLATTFLALRVAHKWVARLADERKDKKNVATPGN